VATACWLAPNSNICLFPPFRYRSSPNNYGGKCLGAKDMAGKKIRRGGRAGRRAGRAKRYGGKKDTAGAKDMAGKAYASAPIILPALFATWHIQHRLLMAMDHGPWTMDNPVSHTQSLIDNRHHQSHPLTPNTLIVNELQSVQPPDGFQSHQ